MAEGQRLVFMGTSGFARDILVGLLNAGKNICAVYTQPDKPAGRGMQTSPSPVKLVALEHNLPLYQPSNFSSEPSRAELAALKPDFLVVASYGLLLPQSVLDIPAIAPLNVHASLLPELRGAAPIQRAIMQYWQPGAVTGVSLMRIVRELDAGPVYGTIEVPIKDQNAAKLTGALAKAGIELILKYLPAIAAGSIEPVPQDNSGATYAHKLTKSDGRIDWHKSMAETDAHIRGVTPWPGAQTTLRFNEKNVPVLIISGKQGEKATTSPGSIRLRKKGLDIACNDGWYEVDSLRPVGRKTISAADFANGLHVDCGIVCKAE